VHLRLEQYDDAIEFCDRALHVCPSHAKALSRRAQAFVKKGDLPPAMADLVKAVKIDPNNEDLRKQHDEVKQTIDDAKAEEAVASVRATLQEVPVPPYSPFHDWNIGGKRSFGSVEEEDGDWNYAQLPVPASPPAACDCDQ
jgi:tetratricopeptide (TPR) repeat protein